MKKPCFADPAAINWPSRNTSNVRRYARHATAASTPAAASISIFILPERRFEGKKKERQPLFSAAFTRKDMTICSPLERIRRLPVSSNPARW